MTLFAIVWTKWTLAVKIVQPVILQFFYYESVFTWSKYRRQFIFKMSSNGVVEIFFLFAKSNKFF